MNARHSREIEEAVAVRPPPEMHRRSKRRPLLILGVIGLTCAVFGARLWWLNTAFAETDDAYVVGRIHPVSARAAGVVTRLYVEDDEQVKAGQVLFDLDTSDNAVQIEKIKVDIAQAEAQIHVGAAQVAQAWAQVEMAKAQQQQAQAAMAKTNQDAERAQSLHTPGVKAISRQEFDTALANLRVAHAELAARQAAIAAAQEQVRSAVSAREAATLKRDALLVQLKDANLQMSYMQVTAPSDGRVGKRSIEVGQRVQAGQSVLSVVEKSVWVTANFKETQLAHMGSNQTATIKLDAFPDREFRAHVRSFSPAAGSQFALLPPDNATGNFTRVVQRVPVRLLLDLSAIPELADRIVPGLSAKVTVDLRHAGTP